MMSAPLGARSVGNLSDLDTTAASVVMYMRLWCDGPEGQAAVWSDLAFALGEVRGRAALAAFEQLCSLCARHGRRPLMRHSVTCDCVGADEACFANFVVTAATGDRDDAMLIATLLVRADVCPVITSLAADFGLGLMRMGLRQPEPAPRPTLVH